MPDSPFGEQPDTNEESWPRFADASIHLKDGHCTIEEMRQEFVNDEEKQLVDRNVYKFELPQSAQEFIVRWQDKQVVRPFSFPIDLKKVGPRANIGCTL